MSDHPDYLRSHPNICRPDPRSEGFSIIGPTGLRTKTFDDHHCAVAELKLHDGVPAPLQVQFETSKNLYLYSWFVYRFHPVARSHAYACLELALKQRFGKEMRVAEELKRQEAEKADRSGKTNKRPRKQPEKANEFSPGLRRLLTYAVSNGFLMNDHFEAWRRKTRVRAKQRHLMETLDEMNRLGLQETQINESEMEITEQDRNHDYLAGLVEALPFIRNEYAHGSTSLDDHSLQALRVVSEIINQIFPRT